MFNLLVAKKEGAAKMDGSACKAIGIGTVNVTCRDGTVSGGGPICRDGTMSGSGPETWYNLISIGVLDEEGCQIQGQQVVITASQGDRVILEGEKCEGIYKLKEGNSVRDGASGINLEGSSSRGGASRKIATRRESNQSITGKRNGAFGQGRDGPRHDGESAKGLGEMGKS